MAADSAQTIEKIEDGHKRSLKTLDRFGYRPHSDDGDAKLRVRLEPLDRSVRRVPRFAASIR